MERQDANIKYLHKISKYIANECYKIDCGFCDLHYIEVPIIVTIATIK